MRCVRRTELHRCAAARASRVCACHPSPIMPVIALATSRSRGATDLCGGSEIGDDGSEMRCVRRTELHRCAAARASRVCACHPSPIMPVIALATSRSRGATDLCGGVGVAGCAGRARRVLTRSVQA